MAWEVMRKSCASHAQNHMADFRHFGGLWATFRLASGREGKERLGGKGSGSEMEQEGERPGKGWAERGWEGRSSKKLAPKSCATPAQ